MSSQNIKKSRKRRRSSESAAVPAGSGPEDMDQLPIAQYRSKLVEAILSQPVTVVVGETGSGKSTQLPQFLSEALHKKSGDGADGRRPGCIVCTQPRRVAAVTIAKRVAAERRCKIGQEVGYSIRFDDCSSVSTRIKFVTDGVLLREALTDSNLSRYSVVILDEAHERSLQTDILMGILKMLLAKRTDLRVVIMSATLESNLFLTYFNQSTLVHIHGRQFPVDVYNTRDAEADFLDAAYITCLQIHEEEEYGGVLVFLPGQEDIDGLRLLLEEGLPLTTPHYARGQTNGGGTIEATAVRNKDSYVIQTLYAAMSPEQQLKAFELPPPGVRKFVLSTNIAETSVTIPGIKYVVDPGLVKVRSLQANTGIDMLRVVPVSQSQANQRSGRAGRESPGKCFRLYREAEFSKLELCAVPEIQRISVAQAMLQLISMGIGNVVDFPYPSPPSQHTLKKALEQLLCLGALGKDMRITPHGKHLAVLPLEPIYANLLLASKNFGCTSEILTVVSMLSSDNLFIQPHGEANKKAAGKAHMSFAALDGDFISLINIYEAWKQAKKDRVWTNRHYLNERALLHAEQVRNQLSQNLAQLGSAVEIDSNSSCLPEREPVLKCLAYGLFLQAATRRMPGQVTSNVSSAGKHNEFRGMNSSGGPGGSSIVTSGRLVLGSQPSDSAASYVTMRGGQVVHIHPSSVLFGASGGGSKRDRLPKHVVYAEQVITSKSYIRYVSKIEGEWLGELRPEFYHRDVFSEGGK